MAAVVLDLLDVVLGEHGGGAPHLGRGGASEMQRRCWAEGHGGARVAELNLRGFLVKWPDLVLLFARKPLFASGLLNLLIYQKNENWVAKILV